MFRKGSLKKRIFAAIAMVLVASTLLVGVSYAWLVLSLRPSADNITTMIGANGTLEIALATPEHLQALIANDMYDDDNSTFATGDPLIDNTLWGNVLDLTNSAYGLQALEIRPTTLNLISNSVQQNPIRAAMYGADGRILSLGSYSSTAAYDPASRTFLIGDVTPYGVRAAGIPANAQLLNRVEQLGAQTLSQTEMLLQEYRTLLLSVLYHEADSHSSYTLTTLRNLLNSLQGIEADAENDITGVPGLIDGVLEIVAAIESGFSTMLGSSETNAVARARSTYADILVRLQEAEARLSELEAADPQPVSLNLAQVKSVLTPIFGDAAVFTYQYEITDENGKHVSYETRVDTNHTLLNSVELTMQFSESSVPYLITQLCGVYEVSDTGNNLQWSAAPEENDVIAQLGGETMEGTYTKALAQLQNQWEQIDSYENGVSALAEKAHADLMRFFLTHALFEKSEEHPEEIYDPERLTTIEGYLLELEGYLDILEDYQKTAVIVYASSGTAGTLTYQKVHALTADNSLLEYLTEANLLTEPYVTIEQEITLRRDEIAAVRESIEALRKDLESFNFNAGRDMYYSDLYDIWNTMTDMSGVNIGGFGIDEFGSHAEEALVDSLGYIEIESNTGLLSELAVLGDFSSFTTNLTDRIRSEDTEDQICFSKYLIGNRIYTYIPDIGHYHRIIGEAYPDYYYHGYVYQAFESIRDNAANIADPQWETVLTSTEAAVNSFRNTDASVLYSAIIPELVLEHAISGAEDGYNPAYHTELGIWLDNFGTVADACENSLKNLILLYAEGTEEPAEGEEDPSLYETLKQASDDGATLEELYTQSGIKDASFVSAYDRYQKLAKGLETARSAYAGLPAGTELTWNQINSVTELFYDTSLDSIMSSSLRAEAPHSLFAKVYSLFSDDQYDEKYYKTSPYSSSYMNGAGASVLIPTDSARPMHIGLYDFNEKSHVSVSPDWEVKDYLYPAYMLAESNIRLDMGDREFVYTNSKSSAQGYAGLVRRYYNLYKASTILQTMAVNAVRTDAADKLGEAATYFDAAQTQELSAALSNLSNAIGAYESYVYYALLTKAASSTTSDEVFQEAVACESVEELLVVLELPAGTAYNDSYYLAQDIKETLSNAAASAETFAANGGASSAAVRDVLNTLYRFNTATVCNVPLSSFISGQYDSKAFIDVLLVSGLGIRVESEVLNSAASLFDTATAGSRIVGTKYSADYTYADLLLAGLGISFIDEWEPERYLTVTYTDLFGYGLPADPSASGLNDSSNYLLSDTYCFALDLLLRTNAQSAKLLLQTEAVQRIGSGAGEGEAQENASFAQTMGSGSYLRASDPVIQNAMTVAFTDTITGEIYAYAYAAEDGSLYLDGDSAIITDLVQNQVKAITVWVYLDGEKVTNMDVDSEAITQLEFNLQFATDVSLVPADQYIFSE